MLPEGRGVGGQPAGSTHQCLRHRRPLQYQAAQAKSENVLVRHLGDALDEGLTGDRSDGF